MKKVLTVLTIVAVASVFTACKKEYTCECTTKSGGIVISTVSHTEKLKKSEAEEWCDEYKVTSGTLTTTCKLK